MWSRNILFGFLRELFDYSKKSKRYFSSKDIWNFSNSSWYSCRNVVLPWCSSWLIIYLTTLPICKWEYENTPYPSCQWNLPLIQFLRLINSLLSTLISLIKSGMKMAGLNPTKRCVWSGMQWTASIFAFLFWTRPVMYLCSSSLFSFGTRLWRPLTAKTNCR